MEIVADKLLNGKCHPFSFSQIEERRSLHLSALSRLSPAQLVRPPKPYPQKEEKELKAGKKASSAQQKAALAL